MIFLPVKMAPTALAEWTLGLCALLRKVSKLFKGGGTLGQVWGISIGE
jgi:hypothetical protein